MQSKNQQKKEFTSQQRALIAKYDEANLNKLAVAKQIFAELEAFRDKDKPEHLKTSRKIKDNIDNLNKLITRLTEQEQKINSLFDEISDKIDSPSINDEHRGHAKDLMLELNKHKDAYFKSGVGDEDAKKDFLTNCKASIENKAENFKGNLGILKSIANFFVKLVNFVLPSRMKFGLFEPKQTEAQAIVKSLESKLEINQDNEQDLSEEELATPTKA